MNRIKILIISGLLLISGAGFAQKGDFVPDKSSGWQDRLYFGGGLGGSLGSWGGSIRLSPIVGYMLTSKVSVGVGVSYEYYRDNRFVPPLEDHRYGGMVFARANLIQNFFAYAEYSFWNYESNFITEERNTIDRLPVGLGLSQPIGPRSSINFLAAYDLLYDNNGPYGTPWVFTIFFSL
jgi:hypothetical protein